MSALDYYVLNAYLGEKGAYFFHQSQAACVVKLREDATSIYRLHSVENEDFFYSWECGIIDFKIVVDDVVSQD